MFVALLTNGIMNESREGNGEPWRIENKIRFFGPRYVTAHLELFAQMIYVSLFNWLVVI